MRLVRVLVLASVIAVSGAATADDSIVVLGKHTEAKPDDPVKISFKKFKVAKATFDPNKIEGSKATIQIDATSLATGVDKVDSYLKTADALDTAKYPTITIDIDKVKKAKQDQQYTADATVKFRDVTKKYGVTFQVTGTTTDTVSIKATYMFSRLDFKIGKDSKDPRVAPAQPELTIQMQLTLKKT
jgi:polyisoprenoid-binding protein YceI